jgi:hypothetical protein
MYIYKTPRCFCSLRQMEQIAGMPMEVPLDGSATRLLIEDTREANNYTEHI